MAQTKFGFAQIKMETPMWATWVFRVTITLTTVAAFVIASDPGIPDALKVRITVYLKALDMLVLGLSKMFGLQIQGEQTEAKVYDGPSDGLIGSRDKDDR